MLAAELDGRIVGFAALITRRPVHFLAELYVRPEHQSKSIGRKLLEQVLLQDDPGAICTLTSDDKRALALYVRHGMEPHWPYFYLRADAADIGDCLAPDMEVVEAQPGDSDLINWDRSICGRERPQDHDYWLRGATVPLWFKR